MNDEQKSKEQTKKGKTAKKESIERIDDAKKSE